MEVPSKIIPDIRFVRSSAHFTQEKKVLQLKDFLSQYFHPANISVMPPGIRWISCDKKLFVLEFSPAMTQNCWHVAFITLQFLQGSKLNPDEFPRPVGEMLREKPYNGHLAFPSRIDIFASDSQLWGFNQELGMKINHTFSFPHALDGENSSVLLLNKYSMILTRIQSLLATFLRHANAEDYVGHEYATVQSYIDTVPQLPTPNFFHVLCPLLEEAPGGDSSD